MWLLWPLYFESLPEYFLLGEAGFLSWKLKALGWWTCRPWLLCHRSSGYDRRRPRVQPRAAPGPRPEDTVAHGVDAALDGDGLLLATTPTKAAGS